MIETKYVVIRSKSTCDKSNRYNDMLFFLTASLLGRLSAFVIQKYSFVRRLKITLTRIEDDTCERWPVSLQW
jgi:hypothetical protein